MRGTTHALYCIDLKTGNRGPALFQQPRGLPNLFFSDIVPSISREFCAAFYSRSLHSCLVFKFRPKRAAISTSTKFKLHATTLSHVSLLHPLFFFFLLVGELNWGYLILSFYLIRLLKKDECT